VVFESVAPIEEIPIVGTGRARAVKYQYIRYWTSSVFAQPLRLGRDGLEAGSAHRPYDDLSLCSAVGSLVGKAMRVRAGRRMVMHKSQTEHVKEHLPPLFLRSTCFIVVPAAVPVTNNLPEQACEHFCQQAKHEAGGCQKM